MNVLILVPDAALRDVLHAMVESLPSRTVWSVSDTAGALSLLATRTVDVMVVDMFLPIVDGFDAVAELRALHPELDVVVLAAHGAFDDLMLERAKAVLGGKIVLPKPVLLKELAAALRELELERGRDDRKH